MPNFSVAIETLLSQREEAVETLIGLEAALAALGHHCRAKQRPWSEEDEAMLVERVNANHTIPVIAAKLGRTEAAIHTRLSKATRPEEKAPVAMAT